MASGGTVHIVQRRSANGTNPAQRATLRSLGLNGIGKSATRPDNDQIRGMIRRVGHLVEVTAGDGEPSKTRKPASRGGNDG
jgi:large subunit ribosomal protein L30